MKALLIDDERLARNELRRLLAAWPDVEIAGEAANGKQAREQLAALSPALIFLDVQMPGETGMELLESLEPPAPHVIFTTAYDEFAVKAFELNALDYLLKPVDDTRLAVALDRVRAQWQQQQAIAQRERLMALLADVQGNGELSPETAAAAGVASAADARRYAKMLPIRSGRETIRLDVTTIDWIDAAGDYMCLHADGQTHVLRATMKELEEMLDPRVFQRVHRSTIVNLARVRSLRPHLNGECFLKLQSGQEVKLSRSFRDKVEMLLDRSGSAPHTHRA